MKAEMTALSVLFRHNCAPMTVPSSRSKPMLIIQQNFVILSYSVSMTHHSAHSASSKKLWTASRDGDALYALSHGGIGLGHVPLKMSGILA